VDSLNRISDHMAAKRLLDHGQSPTAAQIAQPDFDLPAFAKQAAKAA